MFEEQLISTHSHGLPLSYTVVYSYLLSNSLTRREKDVKSWKDIRKQIPELYNASLEKNGKQRNQTFEDTEEYVSSRKSPHPRLVLVRHRIGRIHGPVPQTLPTEPAKIHVTVEDDLGSVDTGVRTTWDIHVGGSLACD